MDQSEASVRDFKHVRTVQWQEHTVIFNCADLKRVGRLIKYYIRSALLIAVPAKLSAVLAPLLARIRPLAWYPGWKFGAGESELDWIGRKRLALWCLFETKHWQVPFQIRWHNGIRITIYLGNDLSRCLYVGGTYEPNEFMYLSQVLQPGMTLIDVGANDGLYTLFAAQRVGSMGKVLALEPSSREFARLEWNLRLNRITNVRALRVAASDREGSAQLRIAGFGHEGQNTLGGFAYSIEQKGSEHVALLTLDGIAKTYNLERIDIIKIDAEGGELGVLRGARQILATHRPLVLVELVEAALVHQSANREALLTFLRTLGYQFWVFGPSGPPEPVSTVELDGVNIIAAHPTTPLCPRSNAL